MSSKKKSEPRHDEIVDPIPHYVVAETEEVVEGALYRFKIKPSSQNGNHVQDKPAKEQLKQLRHP